MVLLLLAAFGAVAIMLRPMLLAYYLLLYMTWDGLASRAAAAAVKINIGSVSIYPLDFAFAVMILLLPLGLMGLAFRRGAGLFSAQPVRRMTVLVLFFLLYQLMRFVVGFLDHVPPQSLIRMFSPNFQAMYFFLPLMFVRGEKQLQRLFMVVVTIALLFPIGQLLFASRHDAEMLLREQGTYRLGYGDSAVPLGFGLLALYIWERRLWLLALPAAGLVMLAHRSAYVAIVLALLVAAVLKGKKLKSLAIMGMGAAGALLVLVLAQHFSGQEVLHYGISRIDQTFAATGTTDARLRVIPYLFGLWEKHPLFGMSYHDIYTFRESLPPGMTDNAGVFHPHNFVLRALVQWGLIGTSLLFAIMGYGLVIARRLARDPGTKSVGVFMFVSQLYFLLFAAMNTTLTSEGFFYWILLGSTLWYAAQPSRATAAKATESAEVPTSREALPILARKKRQLSGISYGE